MQYFTGVITTSLCQHSMTCSSTLYSQCSHAQTSCRALLMLGASWVPAIQVFPIVVCSRLVVHHKMYGSWSDVGSNRINYALLLPFPPSSLNASYEEACSMCVGIVGMCGLIQASARYSGWNCMCWTAGFIIIKYTVLNVIRLYAASNISWIQCTHTGLPTLKFPVYISAMVSDQKMQGQRHQLIIKLKLHFGKGKSTKSINSQSSVNPTHVSLLRNAHLWTVDRCKV